MHFTQLVLWLLRESLVELMHSAPILGYHSVHVVWYILLSGNSRLNQVYFLLNPGFSIITQSYLQLNLLWLNQMVCWAV